MPSINLIKASDGSGNAAVATVQTLRAAFSTTIDVDTVQGFPTTFMGSMGTPHTFVDPITAETITVISEDTAVDFEGHVDGSNLEIDTIAPGYTDGGSAVGDIVIIKPTTEWADNVAAVIAVSHNDDGTIKNDAITSETLFTDNVDPVKRAGELMFNHVATGCVWSADAAGSTRAASMTAGVVYIAGKRLTVAAVNARTFTASKDTYVDFHDNSDGTAAVTYTEVTNNAASPSALTGGGTFADATHIRNAIVVTGATTIAAAASINQGQESRVLPIASSIPYAVTDSLGNLICPRDPGRKVLGYRQITGNLTTTSAGTQATGLSVPVIVPTGRKVEVSAYCPYMSTSTGGAYVVLAVVDGVVGGGGTELNEWRATSDPANNVYGTNPRAVTTPAATSKTYNVSFGTNGGTVTLNAAATTPSYIQVRLL